MLESFQYDYRTEEFTFKGKPYFEELIPKNKLQKGRWEKKRQEVYAISMNRFFRALYREQINEEGFYLVNKNSFMHYGNTTLIPLKDIVVANENMAMLNIREPLLLMSFSMPVTSQTLQKSPLHVSKGEKFPVLIDLLPQRLTIYPDGTYTGSLIIQEYKKSVSLSGLSSILPLEYK